jgi:RNA polymerase sigma factor (TIGR02999 family)
MNEVTPILEAISAGEPQAADRLLPLVYDELRRVAAAKLRQEKPGQTLDATALVHEAYLRLIGSIEGEPRLFAGRGHLLAAAAKTMQRILVDRARRKARLRHGGALEQMEVEDAFGALRVQAPDEDVLAVSEALGELERVDAQAASIVKLHYFLGLSFAEAADALSISERTAYRDWSYARAWLYGRLNNPSG